MLNTHNEIYISKYSSVHNRINVVKTNYKIITKNYIVKYLFSKMTCFVNIKKK